MRHPARQGGDRCSACLSRPWVRTPRCRWAPSPAGPRCAATHPGRRVPDTGAAGTPYGGNRLYDAILAHLRDRGAERLRGRAVDDPGSVRWYERRGRTHTRDLRYSRLDLTWLGYRACGTELQYGRDV
ncbi:hypothetical protein [Actinocatenispora rupis]|uniref:Uncharacterized protein n=1 Tax=Actinocatenispora rupis TaxID=519421 RepID=A0A8J3J1Y0_9ACTN|nr:hypothetical protein [Actinocatenispora rupis]GID10036.1 hypothetical protein Aru02nite_09250 [Actinocatenispora rupis]